MGSGGRVGIIGEYRLAAIDDVWHTDTVGALAIRFAKGPIPDVGMETTRIHVAGVIGANFAIVTVQRVRS